MSEAFKLCGILFIILLCIACYHDLNRNQRIEHTITNNDSYAHYVDKESNFQVLSIRITNSDHFLTIIEQLNPYPLTNIERSVSDFQALNPSANIYDLENGRVYLFPLYKQD